MENQDSVVLKLLTRHLEHANQVLNVIRSNAGSIHEGQKILNKIVDELFNLEQSCSKGKVKASKECRVEIIKCRCKIICIRILVRSAVSVKTPKQFNTLIRQNALDLGGVFSNSILYGFMDEYFFAKHHADMVFQLNMNNNFFKEIYGTKENQQVELKDRLIKEGEDILKIAQEQIKKDEKEQN